jgi:hypothetical protein
MGASPKRPRAPFYPSRVDPVRPVAPAKAPRTRGAALACLLGLLAGSGSCGGGNAEDDDLERIDSYIRSDLRSSLVLEVDHAPGYAPQGSVLSDVESGFADILGKPEGVEARTAASLPSRGSDHVWTADALRQLSREQLDEPVADTAVKMHVLYVDGQLEDQDGDETTQTLGLAIGRTTMVIFKEQLERACRGPRIPVEIEDRLCEVAERLTFVHEVGHLIGLVNNGLPMVEDHEDPDHPRHDINEDCVMFWRVEQSVIEYALNRMASMPRPNLGFDMACLDDIEARKRLGEPDAG